MIKTHLFAVLTAFTLLCGVTSCAKAAPLPVLDVDFADPFILPVGDALVAYATNTDRSSRRLNVQVSRSVDGVHWAAPKDAMPIAPRWARAHDADIWAPEAMRVGTHYVLYFSARHVTRRRPDGLTLCVGAAVSGRSEGPFRPEPEPLTCGNQQGAIDVSWFRDGSQMWLYVKTDGNCCRVTVHVLAQKLSPDGLHLVGQPNTLGRLTNDRAWEGKVVEAPEMRRHHGQLYLFFAGGDYSGAQYAIGYARCASPKGPCDQAAENPILASQPGLIGPGHENVFDWRGRSWIAFAAWRDGHPRYRAMYIAPLDWVAGRPVVALAPSSAR